MSAEAVRARAAEASAIEARFFDRELSWIEFNARVLELARDETVPLLERLRFVAIFS
jgi:polyphosphate kinase